MYKKDLIVPRQVSIPTVSLLRTYCKCVHNVVGNTDTNSIGSNRIPVLPVFRTRIRVGSGFKLVSKSGSRSKKAKIGLRKRKKKLRKFHLY